MYPPMYNFGEKIHDIIEGHTVAFNNVLTAAMTLVLGKNFAGLSVSDVFQLAVMDASNENAAPLRRVLIGQPSNNVSMAEHYDLSSLYLYTNLIYVFKNVLFFFLFVIQNMIFIRCSPLALFLN